MSVCVGMYIGAEDICRALEGKVLSMYIYIHVYICIYIYINVYIFMCVYRRIYMSVCVGMYIGVEDICRALEGKVWRL